MGFEITYKFHPRKEGGGYDLEKVQEKTSKVGKAFDDTPLEKCAAAILSQLARRDVWVVEVEVSELVKKKISFKESTDGKGILLKNKKFSFNATAEMVEEEEVPAAQQLVVPPGMQPHEMMQQAAAPPPGTHPHEVNQIDNLYADPNRSIAPKVQPIQVNQKKILYEVYYEPERYYANEIKALNLKFTVGNKYPVHVVVPHPTGKIDLQKIIVTDDTGKAVRVDEKFFTTAGRGLLAGAELGFSNGREKGANNRLMYDNELTISGPIKGVQGSYQVPESVPEHLRGIPLDDGSFPEEMLNVPNIRQRA